MQVLQEINRDGMALEAHDPPAPGERMRMRLGVYFYAEPAEPPAPPAAQATRSARKKQRKH